MNREIIQMQSALVLVLGRDRYLSKILKIQSHKTSCLRWIQHVKVIVAKQIAFPAGTESAVIATIQRRRFKSTKHMQTDKLTHRVLSTFYM